MEKRLKAWELANQYVTDTKAEILGIDSRLLIARKLANYLEEKDNEPLKEEEKKPIRARNGMILHVFECCDCTEIFYTAEMSKSYPVRCPFCSCDKINQLEY